MILGASQHPRINPIVSNGVRDFALLLGDSLIIDQVEVMSGKVKKTFVNDEAGHVGWVCVQGSIAGTKLSRRARRTRQGSSKTCRGITAFVAHGHAGGPLISAGETPIVRLVAYIYIGRRGLLSCLTQQVQYPWHCLSSMKLES